MENTDYEAAHHYDKEGHLDDDASIVRTMLARARTQPDATYLTWVGGNGATSTLTYVDLERRSGALAEWLDRELALDAGDRVALLARNDIESVVAIYALLRLGCGIAFINPLEPGRRFAELLAGMSVKHVLCTHDTVAGRLPGVRLLPAEGQLPPVASNPFAWVRPAADDDAFFFGTSGSTAASKIVAQTQRNIVWNAEALRRHHGLEPGITFLGCLPIHHVNGLHFTLMATMWSGAHAVLMEAFHPGSFIACLHDHAPVIASVVPSILEILLSAEVSRPFPDTFRYFVSAAAPLPADTCRAVVERFGVRVNQGYGLTETTNFSTTMPADLDDAGYRQLMVDTDIPSIGIALHGNEVEVLLPDGSFADDGQVGEICMRGRNVMRGYDGNDAATAESFEGGWFHSQDLGYRRRLPGSERAFFFITGRLKNMAKVMGIALSLEEMERSLRKLAQVSDVACFTVPDRLLGEAVIAAVVSAQQVPTASLNAHLANDFPAAVLPVRYVHASEIPRTATGKILRTQLRHWFA